ncbi:hypothetical protein OHS33_37135 [Streptomyces sp. NBC_00536]|uniref:hypothetical protein n=1 Tax=Streptomyces sp. NBC_00536 TaxID=2975769 RepID=UPI002E823225|nr:hypothetical protein [Streptomyces sp. NBC_00536]WUC83490.1 hypothetical protein OHS33_37135 [Streptomyces sp. NBC_00536]
MVAALVAVGLLVVLVVADLDTGDKVASIVGAVLAGAGLVVAVLALLRENTSPVGQEVRAGQDGVASGGSIIGSALGVNARASASPAVSSAPAGGETVGPPVIGSVVAEPGGIAAGGDIRDSALGDGSQVQ